MEETASLSLPICCCPLTAPGRCYERTNTYQAPQRLLHLVGTTVTVEVLPMIPQSTGEPSKAVPFPLPRLPSEPILKVENKVHQLKIVSVGFWVD